MSLLHHTHEAHVPTFPEEGYAPDDPTHAPFPALEVVRDHAEHNYGSPDLADFVLRAVQNPSLHPEDKSHDLRVVEDVHEKPLVRH